MCLIEKTASSGFQRFAVFDNIFIATERWNNFERNTCAVAVLMVDKFSL